MSREIINSIILSGLFLLLFFLAEVLYHKFKVKVELTRKFVHFTTGAITMLFPIMLGNHWFVLLLCASFAFILIISLKFNLMPSINAIDRKSYGSISYPISVYTCYLAYDYYEQNYLFFYLPILILAICDPIAALTGRKWPKGKYIINGDNKTLLGSSMFFLSAFILCFIFYFVMNKNNFMWLFFISSLIIALFTTITEAISSKGFDNITIPMATILLLVALNMLHT